VGGLPMQGYLLFRGTTEPAINFHAQLGIVTQYLDQGLENGVTYLY